MERNNTEKQYGSDHANPILLLTKFLSMFDKFIVGKERHHGKGQNDCNPLRQNPIGSKQHRAEKDNPNEQPNKGSILPERDSKLKGPKGILLGFIVGFVVFLYVIVH